MGKKIRISSTGGDGYSSLKAAGTDAVTGKTYTETDATKKATKLKFSRKGGSTAGGRAMEAEPKKY